MFSKDLEQTIGQCYKRAREARHEFMTEEQVLHGHELVAGLAGPLVALADGLLEIFAEHVAWPPTAWP